MLALGALQLVGGVERLREVLAQLVAGAHLQRLAVAHHAFEREGVDGAGEALLGGLAAEHDVDAEHVDHEVRVDLGVDARGVRTGVLVGGVGRVALLPEELGGAQEDARAELPADHVRPLVDQQGQVTVTLHPLGEVLVDDRLGGGPDDDRLLELLAAAVGDHRELGCEALDVLGFLGQVGLRDEHREVGVLRACLLDAGVHLLLHPLPQAVAIRSDDHGAAHRTVVGQFGLVDEVLVPTREVVRLGGENGCLSHGRIVRGVRLLLRIRPASPARECTAPAEGRTPRAHG